MHVSSVEEKIGRKYFSVLRVSKFRYYSVYANLLVCINCFSAWNRNLVEAKLYIFEVEKLLWGEFVNSHIVLRVEDRSYLQRRHTPLAVKTGSKYVTNSPRVCELI